MHKRSVRGCWLLFQKMFSLQITPSTAQPARTVGGTIRRLLQRLVADPAPLERTSRKLAESCNCTTEGVDILVHALAGTGLVSRCGSGWKVKRAYTQLLKKDSFLRYWLDYTDSVISPALLSLEESVRSGKPDGLCRLYGLDSQNFYESVAADPIHGPIFSNFMRAYSSINREAVAQHKVFSGPIKILDMGGGDGDLAMAIVAQHADAHVTVADLPAVIERTNRSFSAHPHADRLHTIGLDLLADSLPQGFDIVLCAHVLDILSPEEIGDLLRKVRGSLAKDGQLVVFTPVTANHGCGPLINSLMGIYFLALARGKGRFYSTSRLREIASSCGFSSFRDFPLPCDEVLLIGQADDSRQDPQATGWSIGKAKQASPSLF
jgi:hypothetical protein